MTADWETGARKEPVKNRGACVAFINVVVLIPLTAIRSDMMLKTEVGSCRRKIWN
jgi:hypothetical protein